VAASVTSADRPPNDALRSWLARGIHTFGIDPRRLGGRGHARRVLGEDRRSAPRAVGGWRELASALQRHTLHSALTRLSSVERQVVTLAYLEGRTNRQIAASLGVSVSTVSRRLWLALEHLDEYAYRTGTWLSSILLLGLVYVIDRFARLGRLANSAAAADWPHKLAAAAAVGAVAAAGVTLVAANRHSSTPMHSPPPATARPIQNLPGVTKSSLPNALPLAPRILTSLTSVTSALPSAPTPATKAPATASGTSGEQSEQGDSQTKESDETEGGPPVVTDKSDSDHKPRQPDQRRVADESRH
jgi:hypothetical protein